MKPATSAHSVSSKSKGGRLVSAKAETKNTTNIGRSGSQYQPNNPKGLFWAATMALRLSEPAQSSTLMMTKTIETSKETICAADLSAARKAYFEFDAQPAMMTPYTCKLDMAKMNRTPTLRSATCQP